MTERAKKSVLTGVIIAVLSGLGGLATSIGNVYLEGKRIEAEAVAAKAQADDESKRKQGFQEDVRIAVAQLQREHDRLTGTVDGLKDFLRARFGKVKASRLLASVGIAVDAEEDPEPLCDDCEDLDIEDLLDEPFDLPPLEDYLDNEPLLDADFEPPVRDFDIEEIVEDEPEPLVEPFTKIAPEPVPVLLERKAPARKSPSREGEKAKWKRVKAQWK